MAAISPEQGRIGKPMPKWRKLLPNYLFLVPYFVFFFLFLAGPNVYGFYISLFNWDILLPNKPFLGFGNYQELWADKLWWLSLRNTVLFAALTVGGNVLLGLFASVLVKQQPPGHQILRFLFYTPVVLSVAVMGVILARVFNTEFGLLNYYVDMVGLPTQKWLGEQRFVIPILSLSTVWWTFGFPFLVFLAGLLNIPEPIYEAARIDGVNRLQSFTHITLPLLKPVTLFIVVTQFIAHFKVFGQMWIMTLGGPGNSSYSVVMYLYDVGWRFFRMGYASSLAFGLAAIILVVTLINFRFLGGRVEY